MFSRRRKKGGQAGAAASAMDGVAYGPGEFDMHRWIDSPADEAVASFASMYAELGAEEAAHARAALTMDDFYTLLHFARRAALASLRGRGEPSLRDGMAALSAIDLERVDWRDALVAGELVAWAMARAGLDHATELRSHESRQDGGMSEALRGIAERPAADLSPGMWRCVPTREGLVLVSEWFGSFDPTVDLMGIAIEVQDLLEADVYRVGSIGAGAELASVWLAAGDDVEGARLRIRACLSVHAIPEPSPEDQHFVAYVAETASAEDAATIAAAAVSTDSHEALGVADEAVCCVLIARSFVIGAPAFEGPGALERFADPIASVLKGRHRR